MQVWSAEHNFLLSRKNFRAFVDYGINISLLSVVKRPENLVYWFTGTYWTAHFSVSGGRFSLLGRLDHAMAPTNRARLLIWLLFNYLCLGLKAEMRWSLCYKLFMTQHAVLRHVHGLSKGCSLWIYTNLHFIIIFREAEDTFSQNHRWRFMKKSAFDSCLSRNAFDILFDFQLFRRRSIDFLLRLFDYCFVHAG